MMIDLHCDTVSRLYQNPGRGTLRQNPFDLDFWRMRNAGFAAQFFALFHDTGKGPGLPALLRQYRLFCAELSRAGDVAAFAGSYRDYAKNRKRGLISAFLAVEDADLFDCDEEALPALHRMGVRLVTLTWNRENALGSPAAGTGTRGGGLTAAGFEFLRELNRLRILPDISHLNDAGARDVIAHSQGPVVASHSNARALSGHPRNLSDELIRGVAGTGGVIGLNFYSAFLTDGGYATAADIARHARHIEKVGGIHAPALGSDFDGIPDGDTEISRVEKLPILREALLREGFSEEGADRVLYRNAEELIRSALPE